MAERPAARLNRILDALTSQVKNHARDYGHLWLERPARVERDVGADFDLAPVPSVFITPGESIVSGEGGVSGSGPLHEDYADVLVILRAKGADGGRRIIELRADFLRAVASNENLTGFEEAGPLCAHIKIGDTSWGQSEDQNTGTVNRAEIPLRILYDWFHDEP